MSAVTGVIERPRRRALAHGGWGVEMVTDEAALERLRGEWERLWCEDEGADVFASYDWFANWWRHFGGRESGAALVARGPGGLLAVPGQLHGLAVCVARDGQGRAAAVLPLVRARGVYRGCRARLLATPINSHAPRTGLVLARDARASTIGALARHIAELRDHDVLLLDGLRGSGGRHEALVRALRAQGLVMGASGQWAHSCVRFEGAREGLLAQKSKHFRKHLGQTTRALEKLGALAVERHAGQEAVERGLPLFLAIDAASWKATDGESIAAHAPLREYYVALCRRFAALGRCEIWVLRVGGVPAAAFLCLAAKGTCHTLKTSFDAAFTSSRRSPSHVLIGEMIRQSWQPQRRGIDFVGRLAFVERWANGETAYRHAAFYRSRWLPLRIALSERARCAAMRLRQRLALRGARPPC